MNKKVLSVVVAVLCVSLTLAGCFSPTGGSSSAGSQPSSEAQTSTAGATLSFWDYTTDSTAGILMEKLVDAYASEKNVKVERTVIKMEDMRNTIKAAINSGEGPDVFNYDIGAGYLGVLAKSGLACDLSDYASQKGWKDRFMPSALSNCTYDGKLYGVGNEVEALGVYYNKKIFSENGIEVPKTYEDFLKICATLKSKGVTPLILTDLDQWPGFHLESLWLNAYVGNKTIGDVLALKTGFDQPEFGAALDKLYEIVKSGYTNDAPNALGNDDANKLFVSGKAAMRPTGTWEMMSFADKEAGLGDDCGFFFLPMINPELPQSAPSGLGGCFAVNAKSKNIDAAADFIDFIFSGDRIQWWYEGSLIPSVQGAEIDKYNISPLFRDVAGSILNAKEAGYNLDVLMPTKVNEATQNYMQELLAGKKTGAQCMKLKQESLKAEVEAKNYEAIAN